MKLTLIGLYNFDKTLFDGITLPEGLDKDTLISSILMRGGEFEVTYPRMEVLKSCISAWSMKWQDTFTRWVNALAIEYEPLENYDRHENWTDTRDIREVNDDQSRMTASSTATDDSTTTNTRSAYDTEGFSNHDKSIYDDDSTLSSSESTDIDRVRTQDDDFVHAGRIHGNVGVTTSQQMLQAELDLGYWNIYEHITDMFLREFTIPVYI